MKNISLRKIYFRMVGQIFPYVTWEKLAKLPNNYRKSIFVLSLDCDTEYDAQVVLDLHKKLCGNGIQALYAVPGELLNLDLSTYTKIRDTNAIFINHGYKQHSLVKMPERIYTNSLSYKGLSNEEIILDIIKGHKTLEEFLGFAPKIFRTPHFGEFQSNRQLELIWTQLEKLDYAYSSSTTPYFAHINGSTKKIGDLIELPLSSNPDKPWKILDSWSYGFSGNEKLSKEDLVSALNTYYREMKSGKILFLNLYADPLQIYDWPELISTISKFSEYNHSSYNIFR